MSSEQLQIGDAVRLKSGGAAMVINDIDGQTAHCAWLDAEAKQHWGSFHIATLEKANRR